MIYMCLSLFFIPCVKWNRQYYVKATCCNIIYSLDPEGKRIARGENPEILPQNLTQVQAGYKSRIKSCENCGLETREDFGFCPKCGKRF
ncbi:MAG: zinc-ribbon domain-containing protein [Lachnospiraceae bacterium]|nr:zinc-ribbon domain-containing protein [Lachnospiraceae bacterium]